MKKMVCSVCTYTYDEAVGITDAGIAPGTKWEMLPAEWRCPWCGAGKEAFREKEEKAEEVAAIPEKPHVERELSAMEMSIVCSNLAKGCEKQYLPEEEKAFLQLAEFFKSKAEPVSESGIGEILKLLEQDLSAGYVYAKAIATEKADRGALRCQVWSERVSRMLQSLLSRYEKEGEAMLENTNVYVCSICGFVYLGDGAPELCPVCKVPAWKFDKMEGRA